MNENIKAGSDIHAGDGGYSVGTQEKYDEFVKVRNQSMGKMRIRKLAEQIYGSQVTNQEQKFAELIVRECSDLVMNDENAFDILKHFGVEE
jgi:hypothetical protein